MRPNYIFPFPDFWDEGEITSTESGIVFTSELVTDETETWTSSTTAGDQEVVSGTEQR